jgi:cytoskeletal protein CcmA (bactofilin family)
VSAHGTGSVRIEALAGSVTAGTAADIRSSAGDITLRAGQNLALGANVDVATAGTGTVSLNAVAGTLTMAGTGNVTATGSSARLRAQGDIALGNVTATDVSIDSDTGAIVNAAGSSKNVTATNLRLQADDAIGAAGRHITTNVETLTALSTGTTTAGIFVTEDDALTVDAVSVSVKEFTRTAGQDEITDAAQSDLVAGGDGDIVLVAGARAGSTGTITLNGGLVVPNAEPTAVSTTGAGRISIVSQTGAVVVNSQILTEQGDVELRSAQSLQWGPQGRAVTTDPAPQAALQILPFDPAQDMVIGGQGAAAAGQWRFSAEDLDRLLPGYSKVVIGGDAYTGTITIDGTVSGGVAFANPVEIRTAAGADVEIKGEFRAESLRVDGDAPLRLTDARVILSETAGLVLQGSASFAGDVTITAPTLAFEGGAGSLTAAQASARLTLLPQDASQTVVIGSGAVAGAADFAVGTRELAALGDGFARIEIGHSSRAADLRVEGRAEFSDGVELWGRAVTMAPGSSIVSSADVTIRAAGDVVVGSIQAAGQTVTVRAEGADSTVEARPVAGTGVNVVATNVVLEGRGPVDGTGRALRVASDRVDVHTPTGMVLRQTQTNGDVHFLVMVDGVNSLQLVNTQRGTVATGNTTLPSVQSTQGIVAPIVDAAGNNPVWALSTGRTQQAAFASLWDGEWSSAASVRALSVGQRPLAAAPRLATADVTWTAAGWTEDDLQGDGLRSAFLLGQPARQPAAAGLLAAGSPAFDYWVENLTL